jgi:hypothetical protein
MNAEESGGIGSRKLANGLVHRDSTDCKLRRQGFFSQTVARNVLPIHDALKELKLDPSFERITATFISL